MKDEESNTQEEMVMAKTALKVRAKKGSLRGKPLLRSVINQILKKPELWDQKHYATETKCGTAYCVAGWACVLGGVPESKMLNGGICEHETAKEFLGLNDDDAACLFYSDATLGEIYDKACELLGKKPKFQPL